MDARPYKQAKFKVISLGECRHVHNRLTRGDGGMGGMPPEHKKAMKSVANG